MGLYDESQYDESHYDEEAMNPVAIISTIGWALEPIPEEEDMANQLNYSLKIQQLDSDSEIISQGDIEASIQLPDSISDDANHRISAGAVDQQIQLNSDLVDFVAITSSSSLVVKFNSPLGTPFNMRAGGALMLDVEAITAIYVTNTSQTNPVKVRVTTGRRTAVPAPVV